MYIHRSNKSASAGLHFRHGAVDAHCDTVHYFQGVKGSYVFSRRNECAHLDLPRMEEGGVRAQFFALFVEPRYGPCGALKRCIQLLDSYYETVGQCSSRLETVGSYNELLRVNGEGKIAAVLTVEGGEVLEGALEVLRILYRLGIRGLGLTWNNRNQLADGVDEPEGSGGLTRFGREVVKEMNNLGMMIDLAHISEKGFFDVMMLTSGPVIVSHANTRMVCGHRRNLTDEQLRALRENGGVIGISFCPSFIGGEDATLDKLLDHFEHAADIAGIDHLGIGSDFDGVEKTIPLLEDVSCLPVLTEGFLRRGFSERDVQKILGENFLRVMGKVCRS